MLRKFRRRDFLFYTLEAMTRKAGRHLVEIHLRWWLIIVEDAPQSPEMNTDVHVPAVVYLTSEFEIGKSLFV